jgi:hypothetical protein
VWKVLTGQLLVEHGSTGLYAVVSRLESQNTDLLEDLTWLPDSRVLLFVHGTSH